MEIFAAVVAELVFERYRCIVLEPRICVIACGPACIERKLRAEFPFRSPEVKPGIVQLALGNEDGRMICNGKVRHLGGSTLSVHKRCRSHEIFHIDFQLIVFIPEHNVLQCQERSGEIVPCDNEVVLHIREVGLGLHDIRIPLLPEFLLLPDQCQCVIQSPNLVGDHIRKLRIIDHVAESLHRGKADIVPQFLLLFNAHHQRSPGDLDIVDGLEAVEKDNAAGDGVPVVERGGRNVCICLRVNASAEITVSVGPCFQ